MDDYIDKLVTLYARHPVAAIQDDPSKIEKAFKPRRKLDDLSTEWNFNRAKNLVETLKEKIEERLGRLTEPSRKATIVACLKLLMKVGMFDNSQPTERSLKLDTLLRLMSGMFDKEWSKEQKEHVSFVFERINTWNCYFLSYTNDGGKTINKRFLDVIEDALLPDVVEKRDWDKDNLLADAVFVYLNRRSIRRGFFDKHEIRQGDDFENKIVPACRSTFAFIQIVHRDTLQNKNDNWCFKEYQEFIGHNEEEISNCERFRQAFGKRYHPIVAERTKEKVVLPDAGVMVEFEPWSQHINDTHHTTLPTDVSDFDDVMDDLMSEIVRLKDAIIENVPD